MQQEIKDGTSGLLQPKTEIIQCDQGEETYLNSLLTKLLQPKNENIITSQDVKIKQEITDSDSEHLVGIVKPSQDQTTDASASGQFEKEGNVNNHNDQNTEKTTMPEQPNVSENVMNNEPEKNITKESAKTITKEREKIINNEFQVSLNNNQSIQMADTLHSNTEQFSNLQQSQENGENSQSKQIEEETNCTLPQSKQQELSNQQDQTTTELNLGQPETQRKIADDPDQSREDSDCIAETDFEGILDNNSDFEIIDIADYDPEFPTEVIDENRSLVKMDVGDTTTDAAKRTTDKPKTNKPKSKQKLNDINKRKFMDSLEKRIMQNKVDPNNLPPRVWKTLRLLSGAQRKKFLKSMKEKYAKMQQINELTNSLSHWLLEHWGAAMEANTSGNAMGRSTSNEPKNEKPFTEAQKRKFMKNLERMIEQGMVDINNLPPRIWNSMKQLKSSERNKFLRAMKLKFANKSGTGQSQIAGTSKSSMLPSSTPKKRNSESSKLPSHSQTTPAWNKNKGKKKTGSAATFSFDRDFQNQKLNERDATNIATTAKVSPNIFTNFFQDGFSHTQSLGNATMDGNILGCNTESPYRSFSDSYRTPSREDTTFRAATNLFSYYNKSFYEGANRPSYDDRSNFQSQSSSSSRHNDGDMNFQLRNTGNTSRTMVKSPYNSRYANDLRMQARCSQETEHSHRDTYSSTRGTLKRKSCDNMASYDHPQPKQSNKPKDDSIKTVITDDSNLNGTMNEEQASLLTAELVHLLDKATSSSQGHIPRFYNSGLVQGLFRITCADQTSVDWLKEMVTNLPQLWTGAKLHVGDFVKFSPRCVSVTLFIPGPLEDSAVTLSRLERQNPGLSTGTWKVWRRTENTRGQVLFVDIDEVSMGVLKKMNFKAFLGLSCVTFQKHHNTPKKRKGKY